MIVILYAIGSSSGSQNKTANSSSSNQSAQSTPIDTSGTNFGANDKLPTEQKEEAPKTWQKAIELSGSSAKRSENFKLNGGQTRLKYTVNGGDSIIASFYVMNEGKSLQEDGGFAEVTATKSGSDETRLTKPAGNYYLDVSAANAEWTVAIEELK
ncbi:hypothetical protein [Amycolatopsis sp. lyj-346]|uniref:hypothetical protein n=1 Tax=Amycolatopsis sp. lyj-346 TaxID=2789289 RepID=UPI00397A52C5